MINRIANQYKSKAFTLIEMAVVLVIVALILGTVIGALNTQMTSQNIKQTIERETVIKQALINYIARNSHLPCPARITDDDAAVSAGNGSCVNSIVVGAPANAYIGAVPWVDLGLLATSVKDTYGRRFTYVVTAKATTLTQDTISGLSGNLAIYPSAADITANTNQLNTCAGLAVCEKLASVILISHGANGLGGYSGSGNLLSDATASNDEKANSDNNNLTFVVHDFNQQAFDDLVMWLKPEDLLTSLNMSGAIKDFRAFNNKQFEKAIISIAAGTTRISGGCPTIPVSDSYNLTTIPNPLSMPLDAWGNPIIKSATPPIGYNFCPGGLGGLTLTSSGMDSTPANISDDIIRSVSDDELISYAIKLH